MPVETSRRRTVGLLAATTLALMAGPVACVAEEVRPLRVLAAASLTEVVEGLSRGYDDAPVEPGFGGSSALARQIRDGAPADVFLSASPEWMDYLRDAGALSGEPVVLARNRLVVIAPAGGPLAARGADDPRALLGAIGPAGRVGIADRGVPAGEYARAALRRLGLLDAYEAHLVGQRDVRAVLHAIEQGELDAGFVYATDARVADVVVLFPFALSTHPPITYQAAVLRDAASPQAARGFLDHLQGEAARRLLADAGFALP